MVCEHCGAVAREGELVCQQCGAMLPVREMGKGAAAIRQGRCGAERHKAPVGSGVPDTREPVRQVLDEEARPRRRPEDEHSATKKEKGKQIRRGGEKKRRHMINWALIGAITLVVLMLAAGGGFLFLKLTNEGQLILARFGYETDATSMWKLGQEYLDQGYIEKAISIEEAAYAKEPERTDIYDLLQQLCEAYEAGARQDDAERIYTVMYTQIDKTNPVAYRNIVRLMLAQNRATEAADFLQLAYTNTSDAAFKTQREEMLPTPPTVSKSAGRYVLPQTISLESAEGYDIYYIIGEEGTLPEDGTLFETPITLEEGGWTVRAVSVSSELVSDELTAKFVITLPTPAAPKASLAPGPYQQKQRIRLRNVGDDPDVTFYYTIDSSAPTINSPIYTEEGVLLPGGKVVVRAVAVNKYGKVSNEMSVELQINIPYKKYYREIDSFSEFQLMSTSYDQFVKKFGTPQSETEIADTAVRGKCVKLTYGWGEARFYYAEKGALLYYIDSTSTALNGPRSTKLGMTETQITEKYRDMGQKENQDGSRSLYYDAYDKCYGKVNKLDDTHKRIDYSYVDTEDDATISLSYYLENGKCVRVVNSFVIN